MKLFITGASGFLGKRLIERLIREKHTITAHARSNSSAKDLLKNKKIKVELNRAGISN